MIGQHKRSLEHCVFFHPAKCLKQEEEIFKRRDELLAEDEVVDVDPDSSNIDHHRHKDSVEACLKGYAENSSEPTRDNSSSQEISSLELCFPIQDSSISSPAPSRFFHSTLDGLLRVRGVPIGSDHQAEVPCWKSNTLDEENREESKLWIGESVWPASSSEESQCLDTDRVGQGRREQCGCVDSDSVECVRRHIEENREKLARELGPSYSKLGLEEMGECVSRKWTEQEEKAFGELVRINPASHRRNFWTPLRYAFPSRRQRDLVSYYFNVFVLRRRALQNRYDRDNVDSDDDEADLPPPVLDEEEWESEYTDEEPEIGEEEEEHEHEELEEEEGPDAEAEVEAEESEFARGVGVGAGDGRFSFRDGGGFEERFSSRDGGGGDGGDGLKVAAFARDDTEMEIFRLSKALDGNDGRWIGDGLEMELASTNGAMQEFFGREGDGIAS